MHALPTAIIMIDRRGKVINIYIPVFSQGILVQQCIGNTPVDMDFLWLSSARISSSGTRRSSKFDNYIVNYSLINIIPFD